MNTYCNNPFSLSGKTILVVGASSGIGRAIAKACAEMGASIIVTARRTAELQSLVDECPGEGHKVITSDITTEEGLNAVINGVNSIDGLVLASGKSVMRPVTFSSRKNFDDIFGLNFFPHAELTRMLVKKKKINNGGSIVFISSIGGVLHISNGNSIYGAAKAALNTFMEFCALEFAPKRIRANSIAPGTVYTPMVNTGGAVTEADFKKDMDTYPLKRYGSPVDIANGAVYLLSDASSWVTGHTLVIDGGKTLI